METGEDAEVRFPSEECIGEKGVGSYALDTNVKQTGETHKLSSPPETELTVNNGEMSPSQEVSSAGGDAMDVDSESTYSCLNASMDKNGVDTDDEHEFTSLNSSSIDNNGLKDDVDGRHKDQTENRCSR
ncbi:Hypothetical predicted protein [Olea europaea subsp. europaea]|uniref:Uncharacterized protein n=1 Tax=Olea europaea subsp. europaea TaxID=158383 RepID=A0A8S0S114_OLEEU|nr:Hypothetical predicted protein [Olea europaea subsp. europaea]